MSSWITATGQLWKVVVFFVLLLLAVANLVLLVLAINDVAIARPIGEFRAVLWAAAALAAAFGWLSWSVRCRRCHGHPAWYLFRSAPIGRWLVLLLMSEACPACGDRPATAGDSHVS